jgi:basic amino acid/polyamine antiporter, APA family
LAERKQFRLERVLTDNALFSSAYGNVGSSIYYALGLVAALALGLTPLVFVIAGILFALTAASYTEATTMYPEAGGSSSFARHAFNETISFGAAWVQVMNFIITAAISALFVPHYLGFIWPWLKDAPGDVIGGAVVILLLAALNIRGVREAARLNLVMAVTDLLTQVALVALGIFVVLNFETLIDNVQWGVAPTWNDLLIAIPVAMIAYTGIETVSNMSEEAIDAPKTVPRAMRKVVLAVVIIYAALPAIALSALPVEQEANGEYVTQLGQSEEEGGFAGDPILGVVKAMNLGAFEGVAEAYVGLLAATILILAANAGMFGVSRLVYSMGQYQQIPRAVTRLHPRFRTPYVGIAGSAFVAAILLLGPAAFLASMYAAFAMLSFTVAHLAVIALRRRYPDSERPYRGPGNIRLASGWTLPVFATLGALGTGTAFIVVVSLDPLIGLIGAVWLAIGFTAYSGYRKRKGLAMSETAKVAVPDPVIENESIYHSVLVVCDPAEDPIESLEISRLLSDHPSHVRFVSLIPVSKGFPMDYPLPSEEEASKRNMKLARRILGSRAQIRQMRCPRDGKATAIIREAQLARAEAIVMPMPPVQRRISRDNLFGGTRLILLEERPCRIVLVEPRTQRGHLSIDPETQYRELPFESKPREESRKKTRLVPTRRRHEEPTKLMVCVFGDKLDDDVVQAAGRMSRSTDNAPAEIHAIAVVRVHDDHDIDDPDPEKVEAMAYALDRAEAVGEEYENVDVVPHLYVARSAPVAVIGVSRKIQPETILIAADDAAAEEREQGSGTRVGKVTQNLMRYADCRVVLTAGAHKDSIEGRSRRQANRPPEEPKDEPKSPAEAARAYAEGI